MRQVVYALLLLAWWTMGCSESESPAVEANMPESFQGDLEFLQSHVEVILLEDESKQSMVAVVPAYQGRIMTSTNQGLAGPSFGWINRELIASGEVQPHINVFGGEDRFWLGPEGGQYGLFFGAGGSFEFENWQTPALIDTEPFATVEQSPRSVLFRREAGIVNYSETLFQIEIEREIELLEAGQIVESFGIDPEEVSVVAFRSRNQLTNRGADPWREETGLLSIWILGMYPPSDEASVIIPYQSGPEEEKGPIVNDDYFGEVPADRLIIGDRAVFFKADGEQRGKIGLSPQRATSVLGSWDERRDILTVVKYNRPVSETRYVNSAWEIQEQPYGGDVINSYNDGPTEPGGDPLGPFYELETSSPALSLAPGESYTHIHETAHFSGPKESLDLLSRELLGVGLDEIPF